MVLRGILKDHRTMAKGTQPLWIWLLVAIGAGLLDHFAWYQTYAYLLFGCCAGLGFTGHRRAWTAAALLSTGAALVHLTMRLAFDFHAGSSWLQESGVRLVVGVLLAALGVTLGWLSRLCWFAARRVRALAASRA
jgi:hypothetical protein